MIKEEEGFFYWRTKVFSYQLDQQKRLSIMAIAELLQEAAGTHANYSHFGYKDIIGNGLVWIIGGMRFEVNSFPLWDDEIIIKTWIVDTKRFMSRRDFQILTPEGEILINASTNWVLYNSIKQRPQSIDTMNFNVVLHPEENSIKQKIINDKISINEILDHNHIVRYSDLDMVGHMNNTRYFREIIDTYSFDFQKANVLKSFEIQFRNEAIYNDKLEVYKQEVKADFFYHEIRRISDSKSICFSKLEWERR